VGFDSAPRKIIVAGPHGDERNAQRVILQTQRYFVNPNTSNTSEDDFPDDLVLYFIPCLSPTMAFADARGIPNEFWKGYTEGSPLKDGPFVIEGEFKISDLHDKLLNPMRNAIQFQSNPLEPDHGVDANRDYYFSLNSSKAFAKFVESLIGIDIRLPNPGEYNGNCTVFMIHGYDSTKASGINKNYCGAVYGQYKVNDSYVGTIPPIIIKYIDFMTQRLFGYKNASSINKDYFYDNDNKVKKYQGEWAWHLYGKDGKPGILSFDIELGESYREGERGAVGTRKYDANKVGDKGMPFFKGSSGYFISENIRKEDTLSFYTFLLNYFDEKERIDNDQKNKQEG
jgi:hypothetical protein